MDDMELVAGCVKGEQKSRMQFLEKYSRLIYTYIKAVVVKQRSQSAQQHLQDIFQEIYYNLFADNARKLRSFKGTNGCTLASWLRQVTINFTIDYLREGPGHVFSVDEDIELPVNPESSVRDGSDASFETLVEEENIRTLDECIERLDAQGRYFLDLHFHRGVSLHDIKEHLKTSRGAVDMYKSRLIARLRECFKSKGFFDG